MRTLRYEKSCTCAKISYSRTNLNVSIKKVGWDSMAENSAMGLTDAEWRLNGT